MSDWSTFFKRSREMQMHKDVAAEWRRVFPVVAALLVLLSSPASGQELWVEGGLSQPIGRFGGYAETGWMMFTGGSFFLGDKRDLGVSVEGFYGSNGLDIPSDHGTLLGALVGLDFKRAVRERETMTIFARVGFLRREEDSGYSSYYDQADSGPAFSAGARYCVPLRGLEGCAALRYLGGFIDGEDGNPSVLGLTAGVRVPLGGR
jgi:hypothetical protein